MVGPCSVCDKFACREHMPKAPPKKTKYKPKQRYKCVFSNGKIIGFRLK